MLVEYANSGPCCGIASSSSVRDTSIPQGAGQVLVALPPTQLLANGLGKEKDGLTPNPGRGSWLQTSPALTIVAI